MGKITEAQPGYDGSQFIAKTRPLDLRPRISALPTDDLSDTPSIVLFPYPIESPSAVPIVSLRKREPLIHVEPWANKDFDKPEEAISNASLRLKELGAPRKLRQTLFTKNGEFRHMDSSGKDLYSISSDEAFEHIIGVIQPEIDAIEFYLDRPTTSDRPYNAHGKEHLQSVHNHTQELLQASKHIGKSARSMRGIRQYPTEASPEKIANRAAIIAALHDLGYLIDPGNHPVASVLLAEKLFPQLLTDLTEWEEIQRGILLHEGDNLRKMLLGAGVKSHSEAVELIAMEYPYVPAIIIADKTDQNRGRVRTGDLLDQKATITNPRIFLEDPHVEMNLLTEITDARWVGETYDKRVGGATTSFKVWVDFTQDLDSEDYEEYKYFLKPRSSRNGFKIGVSDRTTTAYLDGVEYFNSLINRNLATRTLQIGDTMVCSFALNPEQGKFEQIFRDVDRGREVRYPFYRDSLDQDVKGFADSFLLDEAKEKLAYGRLMI